MGPNNATEENLKDAFELLANYDINGLSDMIKELQKKENEKINDYQVEEDI